jgi:hypothetical protein
MQNISSVAELRNAIQLLQIEQAENGQLLRNQFYVTYESFKPFNILRRTFHKLSASSNPVDDIVGTIIGLVTGSLSKKIVVGASGSLIRKLLGTLLQVGVTSVVTQHPDKIKSYGQSILQYFFHKKVANSRHSDR